MRKSKVGIRTLKDFVFNQLPRDSVLREILLAESEEIDVSTFLTLVPVWLKLSALERGENK